MEGHNVDPLKGDIVLEDLDDVDLITLMKWRNELFEILLDIHKNKDYGEPLLYSFVTNLQIVIVGIQKNMNTKQRN